MLGQKFESDEASVLEAIQQFRQLASQKINLDDSKRQSIAREADRIIIRTTNPAKIYVPLYNHRNFIDGSSVGSPFLRFHHTPYRSYYFPHRFSSRNTFYGLTDYFQLSWMDRRIVTFSHSDPEHPFYSRKYRKRHGENTAELMMGSTNEILKNKNKVIDCLAGYVDCVIYPSLDVSVCESTNSFANLKKFNFNLIELLNSNLAIERRVLTSKCSCTHPCHLSDSMAYDTKFLKNYFKN